MNLKSSKEGGLWGMGDEIQKSTNWLSCKTLILLLIFTNQISSTKSNSYIIKNVNEEQAFEYNLQRVHVYIV